jgi:hypothetical protein
MEDMLLGVLVLAADGPPEIALVVSTEVLMATSIEEALITGRNKHKRTNRVGCHGI